jgi:hypothetical protein
MPGLLVRIRNSSEHAGAMPRKTLTVGIRLLRVMEPAYPLRRIRMYGVLRFSDGMLADAAGPRVIISRRKFATA